MKRKAQQSRGMELRPRKPTTRAYSSDDDLDYEDDDASSPTPSSSSSLNTRKRALAANTGDAQYGVADSSVFSISEGSSALVSMLSHAAEAAASGTNSVSKSNRRARKDLDPIVACVPPSDRADRALAYNLKGLGHLLAEQYEEAIECYDYSLALYRWSLAQFENEGGEGGSGIVEQTIYQHLTPPIQTPTSKAGLRKGEIEALVRKGVCERRSGKIEAALLVNDEAIAAARALVSSLEVYSDHERAAEAAVARDVWEAQELLSAALLNKGVTLTSLSPDVSKLSSSAVRTMTVTLKRRQLLLEQAAACSREALNIDYRLYQLSKGNDVRVGGSVIAGCENLLRNLDELDSMSEACSVVQCEMAIWQAYMTGDATTAEKDYLQAHHDQFIAYLKQIHDDDPPEKFTRLCSTLPTDFFEQVPGITLKRAAKTEG